MPPSYKLEELTQKMVFLLNFFVILVRWFDFEPLAGIMILPSPPGEDK